MSLPNVSNLTKPFIDFFNGNYPFGILKLSTVNGTASNLLYLTSGTHRLEDSSSFWELETRKCYENLGGLSLASKWNTDGNVGTDVNYHLKNHKGLKGLSLGLGFNYNLENASRTTKFITNYRNSNGTLNVGIDLGDRVNSRANASVVCILKGQLLLGGLVEMDVSERTMLHNTVTLARMDKDLSLYVTFSNLHQLGGGVLYKVTPRFRAGLEGSWEFAGTGVEHNFNDDNVGQSQQMKASLGVEYVINCSSKIKAKINRLSEVGIAYQIKIRQEGLKVTLAALVDAKNLRGGGHKIGLGFEFQQ